MSPRVIQVIETEITRGEGRTHGDICRIVRQYHTLDGDLLAENDPCPYGYANGSQAMSAAIHRPETPKP